MSSIDISNNIFSDVNKNDKKIEIIETKPKLKRRNAVANLELTDGYKEFIKYYNEIEKK
jgi:hypothetical protein